MPAYLVLLPVEIARFTQTGALPRSGWLLVWAFAQAEHPSRDLGLTRLCCSDPHLAVDSR